MRPTQILGGGERWWEDLRGFSLSENRTFCKYKARFLSEHSKKITFLVVLIAYLT
ncbi:hypothetical protein LSS_23115 [Leptospira santarosai serovar Shermani str. LT 821]|uniref:Uncharacterized protein n=1 Tax=Leptospira santarosai serovar Shermani str. LT 821 TaxID=758847 RepID=A0A097ET05_9LEPT|nr:hypothetical protein LSS_23115 [Leptospira santarosai serovar Shermani str. LT 821]